MNLHKIIETVKDVSGLDITKTTRKREYVYARCIYFRIATKHTVNSIRLIREPVNIKQQQTVYSILNQFDSILKYNNYYTMYQNCLETLDLPSDNSVKLDIDYSGENIKFIRNGILNDLLQLNDDKLLEFHETRLKPYLRLNTMSSK